MDLISPAEFSGHELALPPPGCTSNPKALGSPHVSGVRPEGPPPDRHPEATAHARSLESVIARSEDRASKSTPNALLATPPVLWR